MHWNRETFIATVDTHPQINSWIKHWHRRVENKSVLHLRHKFIVFAAFRRSSEVLQMNAVKRRWKHSCSFVDCKLPRCTVWHFKLTWSRGTVIRNVLFLKNFDSHRRRIPVQTKACTTKNTAKTISTNERMKEWKNEWMNEWMSKSASDRLTHQPTDRPTDQTINHITLILKVLK